MGTEAARIEGELRLTAFAALPRSGMGADRVEGRGLVAVDARPASPPASTFQSLVSLSTPSVSVWRGVWGWRSPVSGTAGRATRCRAQAGVTPRMPTNHASPPTLARPLKPVPKLPDYRAQRESPPEDRKR